jgi:hypothetical protein
MRIHVAGLPQLLTEFVIGLELLRELAKVASLAAELLVRRYARYLITTYPGVELPTFLVAERFKFCEEFFEGPQQGAILRF